MLPPRVWLRILLRGFVGTELHGRLWRWAGSDRGTTVATCIRCIHHSTLWNDTSCSLRLLWVSTLQWQHLDSVVPFFVFTGRPNQKQIHYCHTDRQLLWEDDDPTTRGMLNECCKVCGHGLAVMRDQYSPCLCRQRQHL